MERIEQQGSRITADLYCKILSPLIEDILPRKKVKEMEERKNPSKCDKEGKMEGKFPYDKCSGCQNFKYDDDGFAYCKLNTDPNLI